MVEKDFSLLIGLTVALTVFLVVSLTSIRILRRKGRSPSMYTMTNLSKKLFFDHFPLADCDFHLPKVASNPTSFAQVPYFLLKNTQEYFEVF